MRTIILCIAGLLLGAVNLLAQVDFSVVHYNETKTFVMDGYTYQCDLNPGRYVRLYNKTNKWTNINSVYKDTGEPYIGGGSKDPRITKGVLMSDIAKRIVNNAFTKTEAALLEDREVIFILRVNPESGKVDDVEFNFFTFSPIAKIPLRIFRDIELKLKAQLQFEVTAEGKRLNYIFLGFGHIPTGRADRIRPSDPWDPSDPGTEPIHH
jgi:hypothetical protein